MVHAIIQVICRKAAHDSARAVKGKRLPIGNIFYELGKLFLHRRVNLLLMVLFHNLVQLVGQLYDLLLLGGHEAVLFHEHLLHAINLVLLFS